LADPAPRPGAQRLHFAWVVLVATFITLFGAAAFRAGIGVMIDPLEAEFGWTKGQIGGAMSINLVLYGLCGPYAAAMMARFGIRRTLLCALTVIAIGSLLASRVTALWQLYLTWGVMIGAAAGFLASTLSSTVASRWFVARRGLVTGIMTAGMGSGQLLALPLLSGLANNHGWRWVGLGVAICTIAVVPVVWFGIADSPEQRGLRPYGATGPVERVAPAAKPVAAAFDALRLASRSGAFWILIGSFGVCGLSTNGLIQTHFISAAGDHGILETKAAFYLALIGVFDIIGTIGSGALTDRYDPRKLLFTYYALRGLSLIFLHQAFDMHRLGLLGFIVFYGLDWIATVPPTIALANELFGRNKGPLVYGWLFTAHQLGAALASWGGGVIADSTGSYRLAFVVTGLACLAAAVGSLTIGRPGRQAAHEIPTTIATA
jgi:predicted MFS family arabinose efflux permease